MLDEEDKVLLGLWAIRGGALIMALIIGAATIGSSAGLGVRLFEALR